MSDEGDFWRVRKEHQKECKQATQSENEAELTKACNELGILGRMVTNATWKLQKNGKMYLYYSSTGKGKAEGNGKLKRINNLTQFLTQYFK